MDIDTRTLAWSVHLLFASAVIHVSRIICNQKDSWRAEMAMCFHASWGAWMAFRQLQAEGAGGTAVRARCQAAPAMLATPGL